MWCQYSTNSLQGFFLVINLTDLPGVVGKRTLTLSGLLECIIAEGE